MKYVRRILIGLVLLGLLGLGTTCSVYLKHYEKVHITGTEVKRFDKKNPDGQSSSADVAATKPIAAKTRCPVSSMSIMLQNIMSAMNS